MMYAGAGREGRGEKMDRVSPSCPRYTATRTSKRIMTPHRLDLVGLVVQASTLGTADLSSIPACAMDLFLGRVIPVT